MGENGKFPNPVESREKGQNYAIARLNAIDLLATEGRRRKRSWAFGFHIDMCRYLRPVKCDAILHIYIMRIMIG